MDRFLPEDRAFRVFAMNMAANSSPRSVLDTISDLSDDALAQIIAHNVERCRHLGVDPLAAAPDAMRRQPGFWDCTIEERQDGRKGVIYRFRGIDLADEVHLVFVGEHFLHAIRPENGFLMRLNLLAPVAEGVRMTVLSRSGLLPHRDGGDYLPSLPPIMLSRADNTPPVNLPGRVQAGYHVQKKGSLIKPILKSEKKKRALLKLYRSVNDTMEAAFSCGVYATHGTLLGLVRGGDLIPNDDDFDCAYLSAHSDCDEVSQERFEVFDALHAAGLECKWGVTGHIKVRGHGVEIDLMPAWFDGDGDYNVSGFTSVRLPRHTILPFRTVGLLDQDILIPAAPEAFLEANYGSGWRTPDPFYKSKPNAKAMRHRKRLQPGSRPSRQTVTVENAQDHGAGPA